MCENFKTGKKAVVVGGGLTGLEVVECLNFHGIDVKYLVREKWFFDKSLNEEEALIVHRIMEKKGVELMLEEEIGEFIGENGKLTGIKTNKGNEIECDLAYITIGVVPNISLAKNASLKTDRGIIVNEYQQTSDENIYAAGDCAEIPDPVTGTTIELLWYTARDQGRVAGYNMAKIPTKYKPGIFYNSARFFEVDYLTVGKTQNLNENEKVYAKYKNDKKISMRICYNDEHVIGFNMLGLRWKKDVLESFIIERKNLDYVLNNLKRAAFNPEFSKNYVKEMINV
jgi:NAD(P)H-nitrite reductase large subunit